jgi:hypothetical protein
MKRIIPPIWTRMTKHYLTNPNSECTFNNITLQKEKFVAVRRINLWK